jgi:hypothetical protein
MPLVSVVFYIATRLHLDGDVVDASMVELFGRAGVYLASRQLVDDGVHGEDTRPELQG